ncbi:phasin family protein [Jannaschia aquimarina]|uniref:Phasin domain-containing protein n=1 Tax=Jannaschia aquimarina TaxID=935700 RepID=A0A0D1EEM4_9RHOB|nr:phasin family protein [Jannaschia aquimarina]KIT14320.1 hypothetical protein jaqu_39100 [Jannaschia aquimarina]SNS86016.1 Phasin protein [Jannaschia aquimarina]
MAKETQPKTGKAAERPDMGHALAVAFAPWSMGTRMASTWLEGAARMNAEWARFVADRLETDAEAHHQIAICGSPIEAQSLYAQFLQRSVQDYMTETSRLSQMALRLVPDAKAKA